MGLLRPDLGPVLPGGRGRGEDCWVRLGVDQHPGDSEGRASLEMSVTCLYWAMTASLLVGAKIVETRAPAGLDRAEPGLEVMVRAKRGAAALPGGPGQDGPDGGPDAGMRVTGDQDHASRIFREGDLEPEFAQGLQDKDDPEVDRLGVAQGHARDLPAAPGRHAGDHHQRPRDHPPTHSHVQVRGVDEDVGEPGVVQAAGQELLDDFVDARRGSGRPWSG